MGRDVDHLYARARQNRLVIHEDLRVGKEGVAPFSSFRQGWVGDSEDAIAGLSVRVEMGEGDAAGPDQSDAGPVGGRVAGAVWEVRRSHLRGFFRDQGVAIRVDGLAVRRVAGHGARSTVRFSAAERTAASTMRWPIRASFGSSGPVMASPVSLQ